MTFAYVGYIWTLLGCSLVALFAFGIGASLYFIGKRTERRRPRTIATSMSSLPEHAKGSPSNVSSEGE